MQRVGHNLRETGHSIVAQLAPGLGRKSDGNGQGERVELIHHSRDNVYQLLGGRSKIGWSEGMNTVAGAEMHLARCDALSSSRRTLSHSASQYRVGRRHNRRVHPFDDTGVCNFSQSGMHSGGTYTRVTIPGFPRHTVLTLLSSVHV